jgi:hypothetical protein
MLKLIMDMDTKTCFSSEGHVKFREMKIATVYKKHKVIVAQLEPQEEK